MLKNKYLIISIKMLLGVRCIVIYVIILTDLTETIPVQFL